MVQFGKFVKGRVKRKESKRQMIRIRNHEQTFDDLEKEQQMMKMRRENLKTQMVEE